MQSTSNLQKELLAMSVAAAASMNVGKDNDVPSNKSRKNKTPTRSSFPNNKQQSQQYQPSSRSKDVSSYDTGI